MSLLLAAVLLLEPTHVCIDGVLIDLKGVYSTTNTKPGSVAGKVLDAEFDLPKKDKNGELTCE